MTNVTLNTATRKCTADKYFLGYEGENKINKLIFKFEDGFRDGLGILNVKRGEEKGYLDLKKVGDTYELEVKSALLSKIGEITFQFSVNEPDGTVIKYDSFQMVVKDSIDTDVEMPEDYPNWVDMANSKLAEVDVAIKNAEHATENATKVAEELVDARENGEFNGKDGFSPSAKVTQTEEGAKIEITDENGTTTAVVKHGQGGGEGGGTGADGFSPIANVTETDYGAEVIVTDKKGTTTAKIYNGKDGADGNDGNDGLTPHIGENGNWWIGDTDTGKPSVGSGEGGLAELPMATADTLGGIKVGEGLEITEDGVLSALAGSGSELTALFNGEFTKANGSLALSDNIKNYDMLVVTTYVKGSAGRKGKTITTIIVDEISYTDNEEYIGFYTISGQSTTYWYNVNFGFDSSGDELKTGLIGKGSGFSANEVGIESVYGIKLGGGSTGGYGGGEAKTLWEGSISTSPTSANLNDSFKNYDLLIIEACCDGSGNYKNVARSTVVLDVSTIEFVLASETSTTSNTHNIFTGNGSAWYRILFGFRSETELRVFSINNNSWVKPQITKVTGVKLNAGSSSSGSLDYCFLRVEEEVAASQGMTIPFTKILGTMHAESGKVTVKPGQAVLINITISTHNTDGQRGLVAGEIRNFTTGEKIQAVEPNIGDPNYQQPMSTACMYVNTGSENCEIGYYINNIWRATALRAGFCNMSIVAIN